MCDALKELFAEELEEKYQAGENEGRREGRSELSRLILKLSELGRTDDIVKAAKNPEYQEQLMKELNI